MSVDIDNFDATKFLVAASDTLAAVKSSTWMRKRLRAEEQQFGGFFCVVDQQDVVHVLGRLGYVPRHAVQRHQEAAATKASMLARASIETPSKLVGGQGQMEYAGGVFFAPFALSFVGPLSWLACEFICTRTALVTELTSREHLRSLRAEGRHFLAPPTASDDPSLFIF